MMMMMFLMLSIMMLLVFILLLGVGHEAMFSYIRSLISLVFVNILEPGHTNPELAAKILGQANVLPEHFVSFDPLGPVELLYLGSLVVRWGPLEILLLVGICWDFCGEGGVSLLFVRCWDMRRWRFVGGIRPTSTECSEEPLFWRL